MAVYLDEDMTGEDPAEVCYPHLLLCMGVTVLMNNGSLVGAHFTKPSTEAALGAQMLVLINANGSGMRELYCTANLPDHITHHGGLDVHGKAQMLGFHGDAYSFDTSSINPQHGTFVSVRSNGANHHCAIYYKRDEKVRALYTKGIGPNVTYVKPPTWGPAQIKNIAATTTGLSGPIHKLHKATFVLQIKHHNIP